MNSDVYKRPALTYTLPAYQTACGIADMMAHIMERYFTNTPDVEISDRLCEGTLTAIIKEAYRVKQQPDNYALIFSDHNPSFLLNSSALLLVIPVCFLPSL